MFSLKRFGNSFKDAWHGIIHVFKQEQNFRVQVYISIILLGIMFYFPLRIWEVIVIILLIVMVLTMELLNTALEHFTDMFKPRVHPYVGLIKDIMAGSVFLTSLGALIIGILILWPHFLSLFK